MTKKLSSAEKAVSQTNTHNVIKWVRNSIWAFPLLLAIPFLILVFFKIHGSSIGVYHPALYGQEAKDPDLLYGAPKIVRSDEWLGWTQYTALQEESGYPILNDRLGGDNDLAKASEIPVKDWIAIFRPTSWSFMLLPFEYAFAFKWWFMMYLTIIGAYFFILRILPNQKIFSILMSISFALSPFLLWWYQSALYIAMACGFFAMIVGMRVVNKERVPLIKSEAISNIIYALALAFLGSTLALTIYPPYAIPVAIAAAAFLVGYLLQKAKKKKGILEYVKSLSVFFVASVMVVLVGLVFVFQHRTMIERTAESVYPGHRISTAGDLSLLALTDGFLMPLLQDGAGGSKYYTNQSEASNFILLMPFLIVPGFILQVIEFRKNKRIDWVLMGIQLCAMLFILRALVPIGDGVYKLLLLDRVPGVRLRSGMGILGLVQLVYIVKKTGELKLSSIKSFRKYTYVYGALCLAFLLWTGSKVYRLYPEFLSSYVLLAFFAVFFAIIILSFVTGKRILGAVLLLIFTIGSSFRILPLYRGLDFFQNSRIINTIKDVSEPDDSWITVDVHYYYNLPRVAGRKLLSGSQSYADIELWSQLDKDGEYQDAYNRQARSIFITNKPEMETFELIQPNLFEVKFECSEFLQDNVKFVLAFSSLKHECIELVRTVSYPNVNFYIYKIVE